MPYPIDTLLEGISFRFFYKHELRCPSVLPLIWQRVWASTIYERKDFVKTELDPGSWIVDISFKTSLVVWLVKLIYIIGRLGRGGGWGGIRIVKNCHLGHSFSLYGPPRRPITYIYHMTRTAPRAISLGTIRKKVPYEGPYG